MKTRISIPVVLLFALSAMAASGADLTTSSTLTLPKAGLAREITADEFDRLTKLHGKKLLIVNFWATWCLPCVEELPHFIKAYKNFQDKGVQFVGVSLDFLDERTTRVDPFLKKHKIAWPNFILNADQNKFLERFPGEWSGSLPSTFIYDSKGHLLSHRLRAVTEAELIQLIQQQLDSSAPQTKPTAPQDIALEK